MIDEFDQDSPPRVYFVVADRYAVFTRNDSVLTFSELLGMSDLAADGPAFMCPGLGIDPADWEAVRVSFKETGCGWRVLDPPVPALSRHDVLKLEQANVLLTGLRATGPASYHAELFVHRESEMLLDPTAERQHVPGMLLMEAACQMLIAATIRFLHERRPGVRYYSVMKHLDIEFRRFVFPMPACLDFTVEWWDEKDEERPLFRSLVDVTQGERSVPGRVGGIARSYRIRCLPSRRHRPRMLSPAALDCGAGSWVKRDVHTNRIIGIGAYLPLPVRTDDEIAARFGLPGEWIEQKTGIRVRHVAEPHESVSDMAAAARRAILDAGVDSRQVGLIVAASSTPGRFVPSIGCGVQRRIGADRAVALDVNAACAGFIYALDVALALLRQRPSSGPALVVASERYSRHLDYGDRRTASLFGDGAGAVVLDEVPSPYGFLHTEIGPDGCREDYVRIVADEGRSQDAYTLLMDGRATRAFVEETMPDMLRRAADKVGLPLPDIDVIIPHQANMQLVDGILRQAGISVDQTWSTGHICGTPARRRCRSRSTRPGWRADSRTARRYCWRPSARE